MRIAIVYNAVMGFGAPDEQDVLVQLHSVAAALSDMGHRVAETPCTLDLEDLKLRLESIRPDLVFNLVESLGGSGRLIYLVPALLDAMTLPYTGSSAAAIHLTSHKTMAKERMWAAGMPTPAWIGPFPEELPRIEYPAAAGPRPTADSVAANGGWIVKSLWEHASVGLDEASLQLCDTAADARRAMHARAAELGGSCFAESFVDGREFNLSLLAADGPPQVLPPAEIRFEGFPDGKPKIVGYRAKWQADSYEYQHTPRRFDFDPQDGKLIKRLRGLAADSWRVFGLRGYARVDFRVDAGGRPWILEINANPCLSPDAGFAAALAAAGTDYTTAIGRILGDASIHPSQSSGTLFSGGVNKTFPQ